MEPYFYENADRAKLLDTSERYRDMSNNFLRPKLQIFARFNKNTWLTPSHIRQTLQQDIHWLPSLALIRPNFFLMGYLKEKVYLEIWTIFKQRTRNWGNLSRLVSTGHCTFLVLLCGGAERLLDNGIFYIIFITVFHSFKIQIKFISNITIRFWVAELLIFHKIETFRHTLYFVWL